MANGIVGIYTVTNLGDTEDNDPLRIEIDGDALLPDDKTHFVKMSPRLGKRRTDQGNAFSNQANNPDTGPVPPGLTLHLTFDERNGPSIAKIILRDKMFDFPGGDFPRGRIGFRNDDDTTMNLIPSPGKSGAGYKIVSF